MSLWNESSVPLNEQKSWSFRVVLPQSLGWIASESAAGIEDWQIHPRIRELELKQTRHSGSVRAIRKKVLAASRYHAHPQRILSSCLSFFFFLHFLGTNGVLGPSGPHRCTLRPLREKPLALKAPDPIEHSPGTLPNTLRNGS